MLSIEFCKKVLNKKNSSYSDKQIKAIRDYLNQMAQVMDELKSKLNE
jgi:hypothetical protein|tara:strand:+ start:158 stop:298 length:141 start_codon:yes stop_codon:yes gene_type:complete